MNITKDNLCDLQKTIVSFDCILGVGHISQVYRVMPRSENVSNNYCLFFLKKKLFSKLFSNVINGHLILMSSNGMVDSYDLKQLFPLYEIRFVKRNFDSFYNLQRFGRNKVLNSDSNLCRQEQKIIIKREFSQFMFLIFRLCKKALSRKEVKLSIQSIAPYLVMKEPLNSTEALTGVAVELAQMTFNYFGARIIVKKENQWVVFNGSKVVGGTIGKVFVQEDFYINIYPVVFL